MTEDTIRKAYIRACEYSSISVEKMLARMTVGDAQALVDTPPRELTGWEPTARQYLRQALNA